MKLWIGIFCLFVLCSCGETPELLIPDHDQASIRLLESNDPRLVTANKPRDYGAFEVEINTNKQYYHIFAMTVKFSDLANKPLQENEITLEEIKTRPGVLKLDVENADAYKKNKLLLSVGKNDAGRLTVSVGERSFTYAAADVKLTGWSNISSQKILSLDYPLFIMNGELESNESKDSPVTERFLLGIIPCKDRKSAELDELYKTRSFLINSLTMGVSSDLKKELLVKYY